MPKPKNSPKRYDPNDPEIRHMGQWSWNTRLLWQKVQTAPGDECYVWTGSTSPHANLFGVRKNHKPQMSQAARFIYAEIYNVDVTNLEIRHSCGNRYCCRASHMFAVPNHMTKAKPQYQPKKTIKKIAAQKCEPVNNKPWWQL